MISRWTGRYVEQRLQQSMPRPVLHHKPRPTSSGIRPYPQQARQLIDMLRCMGDDTSIGSNDNAASIHTLAVRLPLRKSYPLPLTALLTAT